MFRTGHLLIYIRVESRRVRLLSTHAYGDRRHNVEDSFPHRGQDCGVRVIDVKEDGGADQRRLGHEQPGSKFTQSTHELEKSPSHLWNSKQHISAQ